MSLIGSFPNGNIFDIFSAAPKSLSIVNTEIGGIHASLEGSGYSFTGTSLSLSYLIYTILIDSPRTGVYCTVTFRSVSEIRLVYTLLWYYFPSSSSSSSPEQTQDILYTSASWYGIIYRYIYVLVYVQALLFALQ